MEEPKKHGSYRKEVRVMERQVFTGETVHGEKGEWTDEWIGARRRGRIMRITDRGVDHQSLWMDQRSQKTQPGRMSRERGNGIKGWRKMMKVG